MEQKIMNPRLKVTNSTTFLIKKLHGNDEGLPYFSMLSKSFTISFFTVPIYKKRERERYKHEIGRLTTILKLTISSGIRTRT